MSGKSDTLVLDHLKLVLSHLQMVQNQLEDEKRRLNGIIKQLGSQAREIDGLAERQSEFTALMMRMEARLEQLEQTGSDRQANAQDGQVFRPEHFNNNHHAPLPNFTAPNGIESDQSVQHYYEPPNGHGYNGRRR